MNKLCCFILLFLATTAVSQAAITDGLVSYWAMDVNNTGTTPDASFQNHLSIAGAPTLVAGHTSTSGSAFLLNGTTDYLFINHPTSNTDTGLPIYVGRRYSVAMWVKGPSTATKAIFTEGNSATATPLVILQTGSGTAATGLGKLDVILRNDQSATLINHGYSTNVVAFDNTWHHVGWVDDNGACRMYVDGNVAAVFNYTNNGTMTVNNTVIGALVRTTTNMQYNASFDDVAVWERALTAAEINEVRTNGIATPIAARPPTLLTQPVSTTKNLGDWALFSASAYGSRPFTYQWYSNGVAVLDATNRTYQAIDLRTNNTGDSFYVAITNAGGYAITTNATVTVIDDPAPNVGNSLVNYWPLDYIGQSGSDLFTSDYYSGNDMLLKNFIDTNDYVSGHSSNALAFDFVTKYGLRNSGSPIFNSSNYSVALWVQGDFTGQTDRRVFSEGSSLANNPLFTLGTDNTGASSSATVFVRNDAGANAELVGRKSTRPVFDNTWHHLVWTDATGKGKLYIDGHLDETDYSYTRGALTLNMTVLGAVARAPLPINYFLGNIDEVVTWKRVLTWTEVQEVMNNGIPALSGPIPAGITIQPPNRTNAIYAGETVSFPVIASGTQPLSYQWYKNTNNIISGVSNPSALTDTLILTNVQLVDSNTFYSVVISNAGGSITSSLARLAVIPWSPVLNGEALKLDIDSSAVADTQPGFSTMSLATNPSSFTNGVKVTLSAIGAALDQRHRPNVAGEAFIANNPPLLTQAQIYNDFVFANNVSTDGTGLRIFIERLATNVAYGVTLWSYDRVSGGARYADWTETSSGTPVPITNTWSIAGVPVNLTNDFTYTFDGSFSPTNDYADTLGALLTSSSTGTLQIEAVRHGGTSFGAFFNGLRLVARPTANKITKTQLVGGGTTLRVTVEGEYPGQPIWLQETPTLSGPTWTTSVSPVVYEKRGPIVVFDIPIGADQAFYRSASYLP